MSRAPSSFLGDRQETPHRWSFETLDPTPPHITRTTPETGASDMPPDSAVTVFFDKALKVGGERVELVLEGPDGRVPGQGAQSWLCGGLRSHGSLWERSSVWQQMGG